MTSKGVTTKLSQQGLLNVIITDGAPSTIKGEDGKKAFRRVKQRPSQAKNIVNFLVTTDQDSDVDYLDGMDKWVPGVDVTDDYLTEADQIRKKTGKKISRGDYVLKAVIGAASKKLDRQDERQGCGPCTIL